MGILNSESIIYGFRIFFADYTWLILLEATFYTQISILFFGLKGQHLSARGSAPGNGNAGKTVRDNMFFERKFLFRTKWIISFPFKWCRLIPSEKRVMLYSTSLRGRFSSCFFYPGRRFGSFLPKLCPGLVYFGLSGRKNRLSSTCVLRVVSISEGETSASGRGGSDL